jgi:hypothetical protein
MHPIAGVQPNAADQRGVGVESEARASPGEGDQHVAHLVAGWIQFARFFVGQHLRSHVADHP